MCKYKIYNRFTFAELVLVSVLSLTLFSSMLKYLKKIKSNFRV